MCYSSQNAAAYQPYVKLTGAAIDLDQLGELYGLLRTGSAVRIPRTVTRWFDEAKNAPERAMLPARSALRDGVRHCTPWMLSLVAALGSFDSESQAQSGMSARC